MRAMLAIIALLALVSASLASDDCQQPEVFFGPADPLLSSQSYRVFIVSDGAGTIVYVKNRYPDITNRPRDWVSHFTMYKVLDVKETYSSEHRATHELVCMVVEEGRIEYINDIPASEQSKETAGTKRVMRMDRGRLLDGSSEDGWGAYYVRFHPNVPEERRAMGDFSHALSMGVAECGSTERILGDVVMKQIKAFIEMAKRQ